MRRLPLLALLLTVMLLTPVSGGPVIDETGTMQTTAPDSRQPTVENSTFWIFGDEALSRCYGHFMFESNTTEEGSSRTGYGQQNTDSGRISIDITCRMEPKLEKEFILKEGSNIVLTLFIEVWGDTGATCDGNPCKDLTLTLERGGQPLLTNSWGMSGNGQERIDWNIPVNETNDVWDKSEGNPSLRIEAEVGAQTGLECVLFDCSADFILYYTHPDSEREAPYQDDCAGCNSNINFPIANITELGSGVGGGDDDGSDGGLNSAEVPGFGAGLALISMLVALVHIQRRRSTSEEETAPAKVHL